MTAEEMIIELNDDIAQVRKEMKIDLDSFLVLKRTILPNPTFPAYKKYSYEVWLTGDNPKLVLCVDTSGNCSKELMEEVLDKKLFRQIISWISGETYYYTVITGTFKGIKNHETT